MEEKELLSVREIQLLILEVMKDVDRFCREHNIPYSLSSGTLLGAVRHGGFIPWDDDADIFMLREDFDRFTSTYKSDKYKLLYHGNTESKVFADGYAKVCDPETFSGNEDKKGTGIYLDIFPLDYVPEEPKACRKRMHKIMSIHNRLYHRRRKDFVSIIKAYRHSLKWWVNKLEKTVHEKKYFDSPLVAHAVGTTNYRTVIHKSRFDDLVDTDFEGYKFLGFKDPHSYLSKVYGEDYMTPRQWSHNLKVYKDEQ